MGTREAMERHGRRLADQARKDGKLPDSRAIERTVQQDFSKVRQSLKPGSTHPMAQERSGERK